MLRVVCAALLAQCSAESNCPHEDNSLLQSRSAQSIGDEKARVCAQIVRLLLSVLGFARVFVCLLTQTK